MESEPDKNLVEKVSQTVSEPPPQPHHGTVTPVQQQTVTAIQHMPVKAETSQPPPAVQRVFVDHVPTSVEPLFPAEPEPKFIMYEGK